ncbi:MAG: hypothetical protein JF614_03310 [Acidobacteria bacterium]|nr:hypothetical protein [Acidobacteriota bacterium]
MSYSSDDLSVFNLLHDVHELEGTAYFELHPHDLPEQHGCWLEGSLFVQDAGFDFFTGCCHRVHPEFDYFAFVRFDRAQVHALGAELSSFVAELVPGASRETVFSRYTSIFGKEIWKDVDTDRLRLAVAAAGAGIRSFIETSTKESGCLWVLGM